MLKINICLCPNMQSDSFDPQQISLDNVQWYSNSEQLTIVCYSPPLILLYVFPIFHIHQSNPPNDEHAQLLLS